MNGNCYFTEGVNPDVTCNKCEGNRIAIPIKKDMYSSNNTGKSK